MGERGRRERLTSLCLNGIEAALIYSIEIYSVTLYSALTDSVSSE